MGSGRTTNLPIQKSMDVCSSRVFWETIPIGSESFRDEIGSKHVLTFMCIYLEVQYFSDWIKFVMPGADGFLALAEGSGTRECGFRG